MARTCGLARVLALALVIGAAHSAAAQDLTPDAAALPPEVTIRILDVNGTFQTWEEDVVDLGASGTTRRVRVYVIPERFIAEHRSSRFGTVSLEGDGLVVWQGAPQERPDGGEDPGFLEFYAAGNVRFVRDRDVLRCEQIFFSATTSRGLLDEARGAFWHPKRRSFFYFSARTFRIESRTAGVALDARAALTPFVRPFLHVRADRLRITKVDNDRIIDVEGPALANRDTAFLPLPSFSKNLDHPSWFTGVSLSDSSLFGFSVYTQFDLGVLATDLLDDDGKRPLDRRWLFELNYHADRGWGLSNRFRYQNADVGLTGDLFAWTIMDRGPISVSTRQRQRVLWRHRQDLFAGGRLTGQLSFFSDREVEFDWYRDEFNQFYNQDSFAELAVDDPAYAVRLFWREQVNDFATLVEYQPRLTFDAFPVPLVTLPLLDRPLYFDASFNLAKITEEQVAGAGIPERRTLRAHAEVAVDVPLDLGFMQIAARAGGRASWFNLEYSLAGQRLPDRYAPFTEATARFSIWRRFDVRSDFFDIQGLRHVLTLEARYRRVFPLTFAHGFSAATVPIFDDSDLLSAGDRLLLVLDTRLEAMRSGALVDLLSLRGETTFFPDPKDNAGMRFAPLTVTLDFRPRNWLTVAGTARYEPLSGTLERFTIAAALVRPDGRVAISHEGVRGESEITGIALSWDVSSSYDFSASLRYDFERREMQTLGVTILRRFPDFALGFTFRRDILLDDTTFVFQVFPAGFFRAREGLSLFSASESGGSAFLGGGGGGGG